MSIVVDVMTYIFRDYDHNQLLLMSPEGLIASAIRYSFLIFALIFDLFGSFAFCTTSSRGIVLYPSFAHLVT